MTVTTLELIITIRTSVDMHRTTKRTYNHLMPSLFCDEIPTSFIIVEVIGKRYKGIKMFKSKFHSQ
jgi:hypothetical protein